MGTKSSNPKTGWQRLMKQPKKLANNFLEKQPLITNGNRYLVLTDFGVYEYNMYKNKWTLYFKYSTPFKI